MSSEQSATLAQTFCDEIIIPGLRIVQRHTGIPTSTDAARMLAAIALQESAMAYRYQIIGNNRPGPARGFWQFERAGGVRGVLRHHTTAKKAQALREACVVLNNEHAVHRALEGHDLLALGFARLLLWTLPRRLPASHQRDEAWKQYLELWRPGKPHPDKWPRNWYLANLATGKREI